MFDSATIRQLAADHDSFYLYDERILNEALGRLLRDFSGCSLLYSLKANPDPVLARRIFAHGFGADAASRTEALLAHEQGCTRENIHYSAPGKSDADMEATLDVATLIADSLGEVRRLEHLAAAKRTVAPIGIRLNPDFSLGGDTGLPSKFGVDSAQFFEALPWIRECEHLRLTGIHVHLRSQELNVAVLRRYHERIFELAAAVRESLGEPLRFINLGSGLGVPYAIEDQPLDTARLGEALRELRQRFASSLGASRVFLETGRFAICRSGVYVTRVMDKKMSHGRTFVILDKTLNGFLRPCLAQLVTTFAGDHETSPYEPLFTARDACAIHVIPWDTTRKSGLEMVTLVGNLCTASDVIARDIRLPRLEPGDMVVLTHAGSYASVLTPMQFSSHDAPRQFLRTCRGDVISLA